MAEAILEAGVVMGWAALQAAGYGGNAVSNEAIWVRESLINVSKSAESSRALFGPKADLLNSLEQLSIECAEADWDGYGAEPVSVITLARARAFIRSLPENFPLAELSVEPDGAVSLDWMPSANRTLSVSLGETGRVPYAWVDGIDCGHAVARIVDEAVPARVLAEIERICENEPALRTA